MSAREEMQKEYEQDLNNLFVEDLRHSLMSFYRKQLSLNIKRGIAAKRRKNAQSK